MCVRPGELCYLFTLLLFDAGRFEPLSLRRDPHHLLGGPVGLRQPAVTDVVLQKQELTVFSVGHIGKVTADAAVEG